MHLYPELELFVIYAIMALVLTGPKVCCSNPGEEDMTRLFDKTFWGLTIGLVALFALNFLLEEWMRSIGLQSLSRGCVAIGLLVLWRTGLVSFGQRCSSVSAPTRWRCCRSSG